MSISVALCTYNGEKFLPAQLDSILNQKLPVDEIVVCDDGSRDKTISILEDYAEKHPGIFRIHQNEVNLRSVRNFEKAITLCTGDFIFLSDQDDVWLPEKTQTIVQHFSKNPNIEAVATNGYAINDAGERLHRLSLWEGPTLLKKQGSSADYFRIITEMSNIATGASMAIRRRVVPALLPFPSLPDYHHDEWIATYTAAQGTFDFLDEKLFEYREHDSQQVGGVFLTDCEKGNRTLNAVFSDEVFHNGATGYKRRMKRQVISAKNLLKLKEKSGNKEFNLKLEARLKQLQQDFFQTQKNFRAKHFWQFQLISFIDRFTNKRQFPHL